MTCLPDANVWLALAVDGHVHHQVARQWLDSRHNDTIGFCRITEMALLRLLTNGVVMGPDVLTPAGAWAVRDALAEDDRVVFLPEPAGFDLHWRKHSTRKRGGRNFWTDAWLVAFAEACGCLLVTLDRGLRTGGKGRVHVLGSAGD